ncbi:hypothetical protein [Accumulibacter sp.]|uniref:hypothetical protein n=1 Tax=Accumulibacter sp. TaxID=2053492 RepID=UPI0028C4E1A7|nr:hypothetical protein [Accumulibacter sp.]
MKETPNEASPIPVEGKPMRHRKSTMGSAGALTAIDCEQIPRTLVDQPARAIDHLKESL